MKFLLSVLLLISELFSIIKTGTELYCYETTPYSLCWEEIRNFARSKYGFGGNQHQLETDALSCLKSSHNEENKSCEHLNSVCSKLSLKFKDGKQNFFTYCDKRRDGELLMCRVLETFLKKDALALADAKCDYCLISGCNSSPKDTPHLESSSHLEGEKLACLQTSFQDLCIPETLDLRQATKLGKPNLYEHINNALTCYKRKKHENLELCEKGKTQCSILTLKFEDGTHTTAKTCDTDRNTTCEYYKEKIKKYLTAGISSAQCDYCTGDSCNSLEEPDEPPTEDMSDLSCFETELDYMCERELTNWKENPYGNSHLESDALNCLKRQNEVVNRKQCKWLHSMCAKLSLKFKDDIVTEFRFCDSYYICDIYKDYLNIELKDELLNAQCDYCSENFCNSNLENTTFRDPESEEEQTKLRCYHSDSDSCKKRIKVTDAYAFASCASRAEVKKKEDCNLCMTEIFTNSDNQKMITVSCATEIYEEMFCENSTMKNKILQDLSRGKLKSVICIPCRYDLCNDPEKQELTRSEDGNQVVSNPPVIIFISLLVWLTF